MPWLLIPRPTSQFISCRRERLVFIPRPQAPTHLSPLALRPSFYAFGTSVIIKIPILSNAKPPSTFISGLLVRPNIVGLKLKLLLQCLVDIPPVIVILNKFQAPNPANMAVGNKLFGAQVPIFHPFCNVVREQFCKSCIRRQFLLDQGLIVKDWRFEQWTRWGRVR